MKKKFQEFTYNRIVKGKLIPIYTVAFPIDEKEHDSIYKMGFLVSVHDVKAFSNAGEIGEKARYENPWKYSFPRDGGWVIGPIEERQVFTKTVEYI